MSQPHRTAPDGVIRSAELRAAGMSGYAVSARCRPSGPWRRVLPGVVLMSTGPPTRRQWLRAAIAYTGAGAVLTGADALCLQGIEVPRPADVVVLLPATRRAASRPRLTVERTTRPPEPVWREGLPLAPVVRATVDAARREHDHDRLRALLLAPVLAGACTIPELLAELAAGSQRGTAAARAVLTHPPSPHRVPGVLLDGLPVLVGQLGLDVTRMGPGAVRAQPEPSTLGVLGDPGERPDRRLVGTRSTTPGTSNVGLVGHGL